MLTESWAGMLAAPLTGYRKRRDAVRPPVPVNLEINTYPITCVSWL